MSDAAIHSVLAQPRQRGPRAQFTGATLVELAAYLAEPGSTIREAAAKFNCSESTIEKTLARLRRPKGKGPAPTTSPTPANQGAEVPDQPTKPTREGAV